MKIYSNYSNPPAYRRQQPQSTISITVPNQAPSLRYIIGALQRGESLNIQQAMLYDKEPALDDLDLRNVDRRHMSVSDIDAYISLTTPTAMQEPPLNDNTLTDNLPEVV